MLMFNRSRGGVSEARPLSSPTPSIKGVISEASSVILQLQTDNDTKTFTMHNDSELIHCEQCEMKRIEDTLWDSGLFVKLVSLAILAVLTTGANVFLIYIASRTKSLVSNTRVFVISLCVAHLLGSVIIIPMWITTRVMPDLALNSPVFCQTVAFVWILMTLASFYSLSAISVDRFCIISNPMRYPVKATTPKKLIAVTCIWVFSASFASAPDFGWGQYRFRPDAIPVCGLDIKQSLSYALVLLFFGFLAPLLIDIICCARIISIAMRQSRAIDARKGSSSNVSISSNMSATSSNNLHPSSRLSKLKQKLNSVRLVFAGTGNFLVCWLPYIVDHVWMTSTQNVSQDSGSAPYILEFVVMWIALLNGFVNPIVILFSNRDYTKRVKLLFFKRFGFFKDEIIEDRGSDYDSSVTNLRRSQQYKSANLVEIFQAMNQITENIPIEVKTVVNKSDDKPDFVNQRSESFICMEDIRTPSSCFVTTPTKDTNELAAERRRLMSQRSRSNSSMEAEYAFFPSNEPPHSLHLVAITEDKNGVLHTEHGLTHVTIAVEMPGIVIK